MPPSRSALKRAKSETARRMRASKFTVIVIEQGGLCWYCNEPMGADCTREHLLAKALGGTDHEPEGNIKAAHGDCNSAAGHLPVEDKYRLREIGHNEGREAMIKAGYQLRRADARMAFAIEGKRMVLSKPERAKKYWAKLGLPGKPSWWDG